MARSARGVEGAEKRGTGGETPDFRNRHRVARTRKASRREARIRRAPRELCRAIRGDGLRASARGGLGMPDGIARGDRAMAILGRASAAEDAAGRGPARGTGRGRTFFPRTIARMGRGKCGGESVGSRRDRGVRRRSRAVGAPRTGRSIPPNGLGGKGGKTHKMSLTKKPTNPMTMNPMPVRRATLLNSLRSGLVQRLTRRMESLANSLTGFTAMSATSMATVRGGRRSVRARGCCAARRRPARAKREKARGGRGFVSARRASGFTAVASPALARCRP